MSKKASNKSKTARAGRRGSGWAGKVLIAFGALVVVLLFLLVREVRTAPPRDKDSADPSRKEANPLTDVAPRQRRVPGMGPSMDDRRAAATNEDGVEQPRAKPGPYKLPPDLPDPANPPQWTKPLAVPGEPRPPDPFTPPEIEQDPDRGRRPSDQK